MSEEGLKNCGTLVMNESSSVPLKCCKRAANDIVEEAKRLKTQHEPDEVVDKLNHSVSAKDNGDFNEEQKCADLLVFSDDILLMIISNLNHSSIINLSKTCSRLYRICQDHTLWREVHFGDNVVTQTEMNVLLKYVSAETKSIYAKGYHETQEMLDDTLSPEWLAEIRAKCTNLLSLSLPNHYINCKHINIHQFPKTLVKLDLSSTYLKNVPWNKSYFKELCLILPDLEVLILSNCHWFEPHSLMALSKCAKLKELRLDNCVKVKDCVAYCGLATRSGFKSLKTLDLRKCPVGTSELICFTSVSSIVNLYLESPPSDDSNANLTVENPIKLLFTTEPMIEIRPDGNLEKVTCPKLKIERLVVRNYKEMTDHSLNSLAQKALFLKYLDVSGSGVTAEGIERFKTLRPNVTLVNDSL